MLGKSVVASSNGWKSAGSQLNRIVMILTFARMSFSLFTVFVLATGMSVYGCEVDSQMAIEHLQSIGVEFGRQGDEIVSARFLQSSSI